MKVIQDSGGGIKVRLEKVSISNDIDYRAILRQVPPDKEVLIFTYSLYADSGMDYYVEALSHLRNCTVVCQERDAAKFKAAFEEKLPNVKLVQGKKETHAKILLIAPDNVFLSSKNFGTSDWMQHAILIVDKDVYKHYYNNCIAYIEKGYTGNLKTLREQLDLPRVKRDGKIGTVDGSINYAEIKNVEAILAYSCNLNQRLNNVTDRDIHICTQTIPNLKYACTMIEKLLKKRNHVTIYANDVSTARLVQIKKLYPEVEYKTFKNLHAKWIAISALNPGKEDLIWLTSENFGTSGWYENLIRIKSSKVYNFYMDQIRKFDGK